MNEIELAETQKRIRKGTLLLFEIQRSIEKLPDSDLRIEMLAKHDGVLMKISELQALITDDDTHKCWYGFRDKCPGCACADCVSMIAAFEITETQTVDDFDATRVERAARFYEERQHAEVPF